VPLTGDTEDAAVSETQQVRELTRRVRARPWSSNDAFAPSVSIAPNGAERVSARALTPLVGHAFIAATERQTSSEREAGGAERHNSAVEADGLPT
jgi:hypothetical protein